MKIHQTNTHKNRLLVGLLLLLLIMSACGGGNESTISDIAEGVSTAQAGIEQIEEIATAASETANATPETGPGTVIDDPIEIAFDQPYESFVNGNNFERFYRLSLPAGAILNLDAANSAESKGDVAFRLVTMAGGFPTPIAEETVPIGENRSIKFITGSDGGGTYLLIPRGGFLGTDTFNFTAVMTMQDDAASGGDAVADPVAGTEITTGTFTGLLGGDDRIDAYRFTAPARSYMRVTLTNSSDSLGAFEAEVSRDGAHIRYYTDRYAAPGNDMVFAMDTLDEVVFNVELTAETTKEAVYTLTVEVTTQNDADSGGDAGEEIGTATPINVGQTYEAFRGEGESDCYQVATAADQALTIIINSLTDEFFGGRPIIRMYDESGNTLAVGGGPTPGASETVEGTAVSASTFFCVAGGGNAAPYTFIVENK
ncbi:MAG: hypothetical protein KC419_10415 [Anaerolineales bacterium]|nr:hypothetical protein [Anaerolineales bacterium]